MDLHKSAEEIDSQLTEKYNWKKERERYRDELAEVLCNHLLSHLA